MNLTRGFDLDPSCKLWLPFYAYDKNVGKIWDQSGNGNHGAITGATPAVYPIAGGLELVSNGGMESGNPPTGWTALGVPDTFEQSGVQKHGGSFSAHVISLSAAYKGFYQNLSFISGKTYRLSWWGYLDSGVSGGIYIQQTDGLGSALYASSIPHTLDAWSYHEVTFTAVETGSVAGLSFRSASETAHFYIDDVSVQEVVGYESIGWGFDGVDDKVDLPSTLSSYMGVSIGTILTWVRIPVQTLRANASVVGLSPIFASNNGNVFIGFGTLTGTGDGTYVAGYSTAEKIVQLPLLYNQWLCIGWVHSGGTLYGYFNGSLVGSIACADIGGAADTLTLAQFSTRFGKFFLPDNLILNRALSATEIRNYYENTRRIYGV